jgi:hypothetical protein
MSASDIAAIAARRAEIAAQLAELAAAREACEAEARELELTVRVLTRLQELMQPDLSRVQASAEAHDAPKGPLGALKTFISAHMPHQGGED